MKFSVFKKQVTPQRQSDMGCVTPGGVTRAVVGHAREGGFSTLGADRCDAPLPSLQRMRCLNLIRGGPEVGSGFFSIQSLFLHSLYSAFSS